MINTRVFQVIPDLCLVVEHFLNILLWFPASAIILLLYVLLVHSRYYKQ